VDIEQIISEFQKKRARIQKFADTVGGHNERVDFARSFCGHTLTAYWTDLCKRNNTSWDVHEPFFTLNEIPKNWMQFSSDIGSILAKLPFDESNYLIGTLYTALLPKTARSDYGAYYTPPVLVNRLIDLVSRENFDWSNNKIMDLSCGGGAFISPVALKILEELPGKDAVETITHIKTHIEGFDIDPFAAWMSQVLVEIALLAQCIEADTRLPRVVAVCNTLETFPQQGQEADLVIGNPPYRKITLPEDLRKVYQRSLYGHANLYGVFTDIAIRWTKPTGYIAYVTPTSFLGGKYFKALRGLLSKQAPPVSIDFITERKGVFEDVLQETMLVVYARRKEERGGGKPKLVSVHSLKPNGCRTAAICNEVGLIPLPSNGEEPWLIPREQKQVSLFKNLVKMDRRLGSYGFDVNTGPLVWNRHKGQLRSEGEGGTLPIIWSESITGEGSFSFSAERTNHSPFILPNKNQSHLITSDPCILVQRTTAKEQKKRLLAAELPRSFISKHGGVVVENHVNIIRHVNESPPFSLKAFTALLNTTVLDQIFRLISGSVAVSAYELNALPLPDPECMAMLEELVKSNASKEKIEKTVEEIYQRTQ